MSGKNNLKPIRSAGEAREKGRKGGLKSAQTRARQKTFREIGAAMLSMKPGAILLSKLKTLYPDICEDWTVKDIMFHAQTAKALQGDTRAFETVRDTIGEVVESKQGVSVTGSLETNDLSKLDKKTLLAMAKAADLEITEG